MNPCDQIGNITEIKTNLARMIHVVEGNGQPGIKETVVELSSQVKNLIVSINDLRTVTSGLQKFEMVTIGEVKEKQRNVSNMRWAIGTIIMLLGLIISIKTGIL